MYILGASGHARVLIDLVETLDMEITEVFDNDTNITSCLGYPVSPMESLDPNPSIEAIIAIGNNVWRKSLAETYEDRLSWARLIHPSATVSKYAVLGPGSVVMAGAIIQSKAIIGLHAIINTKASIDHDCKVGDFTLIAPNVTLCGNVCIGSSCLIGAGTTVIPGITIGDDCIVGAGSVVLRDLRSGEKVNGLIKRI